MEDPWVDMEELVDMEDPWVDMVVVLEELVVMEDPWVDMEELVDMEDPWVDMVAVLEELVDTNNSQLSDTENMLQSCLIFVLIECIA